MTTPTDDELIRYALRFGGMCRDCADTAIRGICDHSGMPCSSDTNRKVIRHALEAWRYGVKHRFLSGMPDVEPTV